MEFTVKKFGRPAALGALAVCVGTLGVYFLIAFGSRHTATGGIDNTQAVLTWISVAVPVALIIAVHVVAARVLLRYAKEPDGD
ncbi:MAG TPA: hypothetical protein VF178_13945 [Gemmatimonadaceae bacterium]